MAYYKSGGINVTSNSNVSINTASGLIASFNTNLSMPVLETKATINPVQNGTPWIDSNVVNKEPYIKRAVVGTATRIGNHLYDKLVGGTVAFNQLVKNGNFANTDNWGKIGCTLSASDNIGTLTTTETNNPYIEQRFYYVANHLYLFTADLKNGNKGSVSLIAVYDNEYATKIVSATGTAWETISFIIKPSITETENKGRFRIRLSDTSNVGATCEIKNCMLFDLTQMFGSTIADYIYSLEQATAGAGVAWFKALFPNDYYAYNAGELMSVKATAHIMKNASNTVIGNYALDSNLELRGIPKLVNNKLEYDGDTYESSGAVGRRFALVDLGSLSWSGSNGQFYSTSLNAIIKKGSLGDYNHILCIKYIAVNIDSLSNLGNYEMSVDRNGNVQVRDDNYTDSITFKSSLSGQYLLYELATPTTEQAAPFTNPQVCDENGTEEYTDNRAVAIPVGHETYQANISPISGHTEANITRCGVNLWELSDDTKNDGDRLTIDYINNGVKLTANDLYARASYVYKVKAGQTYTLSYYGYGTANFIQVYYNNAITWNPQNYGRQLLTSTRTKYTKTITATSDVLFVGFYVTSTGTTGDMIIEDFMLEIGSTASDTFTHYNGQTYAIAFGQTVYGGVLDVTRGKLHVTHGKYTLNDVSNLSRNSDHSFYFGATPAPKATGTAYYTGVISDKFMPGETVNQDVIFIHPNGLVRFNTSNGYATTAECFANIGEITVIYPLATPFDIDLTPVQINTLLGVNNVWHDDNGDTEVKYRKVNT